MHGSGVWLEPVPLEQRGWPAKVLPFNLVHRLTGGLRDSYAKVRASRTGGGAELDAAAVTLANGQMSLSPTMPLIGQRYRYLHTLSESDLSQIVSVVDTYRHCAPTLDGRRSPLVAVKVLNAQHWTLGAQEYERMRQLWRSLSAGGARPRVARPLAHFEDGAHFCIVFDLLAPLAKLHSPLAAAAAAVAAATSIATSASAGAAMPSAAVAANGALLSAEGLARPLPLACAFPPLAGYGGGSGMMGGGLLGGGLGGGSGALGGAGCSPAVGAGLSRAARPRLSLATLRHATAQLLGALASLHTHGVLHADLKPDNLLVEPHADGGGAGGVWSSSSSGIEGDGIEGGRIVCLRV